MKEERDEVVNQFASIHETELKDEDYLINYDPAEITTEKLRSLIMNHVSTTGSALCAGKYAGHGFALSWYGEFEGCQWLVKNHVDWNKNISHILIPVRKGVISRPDDPEKIEYRMLLQKILRVDNPKVEDIKTQIGYLLNRYPQK